MSERVLTVALSALMEPGNRELGELVRRVGSGAAVERIRAGKVMPLVVNGTRRPEILPEVPTTREAGLVDAGAAGDGGRLHRVG